LNEMSVINGYTDATFKPENPITRGHAAAMINRVLKLEATTKVTFKDVAPDYAFLDDIVALNEAGILQGYATGELGVNDKLTLTQLAIIVDRAFGLQEEMDKYAQQAAQTYKDVPSSHWASEAIHALKTLDQTRLFQTTNFNPGNEASRAEFSAAIFTAISKN